MPTTPNAANRRMLLWLLGIVVAAIGALAMRSAASQSAAPTPQHSAARGELIAERLCRYCHQIRPGASSDVEAQAPSFVAIANTPGRDAAFLRRFAEEMHIVRSIGNPNVVMPTAILTNDAREDVILYILSFKR